LKLDFSPFISEITKQAKELVKQNDASLEKALPIATEKTIKSYLPNFDFKKNPINYRIKNLKLGRNEVTIEGEGVNLILKSDWRNIESILKLGALKEEVNKVNKK
jgi:flagellar basal body rod protein FlgB